MRLQCAAAVSTTSMRTSRVSSGHCRCCCSCSRADVPVYGTHEVQRLQQHRELLHELLWRGSYTRREVQLPRATPTTSTASKLKLGGGA